MSGLRSKRRHRPELPLVPLIDVLVMLVLFSFVTMRFASTQTLNITLPKVTTAGKNAFEGVNIVAIDKDGKMTLNSRPFNLDQLEPLMQRIKNSGADAQILISADEKTPFDNVIHVMDVCQKVGLTKFRVQGR